MAFLTSRSASKHFFTLGVNPIARHAVKAGFRPQSLASYTFAVSCETSIRPMFPSLHKPSIASLARRQANAVEFATKFASRSSMAH